MSRFPRSSRALATVVAAGSLAAAVVGVAATPAGMVAAATEASAFSPVTPCRLLDTRDEGSRLRAGRSIDVDVADECGVPGTATAVAVTITVIAPLDRGYVTASPTGVPRPTASALNYRAGATIGNLQLVQIGEDGAISVYSRASTHLTVDVTGFFATADGGTAKAGRFVPVTQRRLIDTRDTGRPGRRTSVRVEPDVPEDAVAVAVSIATTASRGPGYFTAYGAGQRRPTAAVLNTDRAGQTRAASAIVPLSDGAFEVYTRAGDHVIVDLTGYMTGPDADVSGDGLFVATVPTRLVDTREARAPGGGPRLWDGGTREFDVEPVTGGEVAAIAATLTVVGTEDRGYATAYPARTDRPATSSINYDTAQATIASTSLMPVSERGVAVYAKEATHAVLDVTGWFTGDAVAASGPAPVNRAPAPRRVTIIGDSAFAGMRWNGTLAGLQGMVADDRLESCRRLVQFSCRGREGYAPRTVQSEINALAPVGPEEILVITAGYDDWHTRFAGDFDVIVATARAAGFHHIVWVTYRSSVGYVTPTGGRTNYGEMNRIVAAKLATGAYPDVRLWDYDAYTAAGATDWFYTDGIHERPLGSWGTADYLSRQVAAFDDKPCPQPWRPGAAVADPCPPALESLGDEGGLPDIVGLYGLG